MYSTIGGIVIIGGIGTALVLNDAKIAEEAARTAFKKGRKMIRLIPTDYVPKSKQLPLITKEKIERIQIPKVLNNTNLKKTSEAFNEYISSNCSVKIGEFIKNPQKFLMTSEIKRKLLLAEKVQKMFELYKKKNDNDGLAYIIPNMSKPGRLVWVGVFIVWFMVIYYNYDDYEPIN